MILLILLCLAVPLSAQTCPLSVGPVSDTDRSALQQSRLVVAAELLKTVAAGNPSQNVFMSPYSIQEAFLLALFGSSGNTETLLRNLLRIPDTLAKNTLVGIYVEEKNEIESNNQTDPQAYELNNANRIYIQEGLRMRPCVQELFSEEFSEIDFTQEGPVDIINEWVAKETKNMINPFLPKDYLDSLTRLVVVNAVYFKGTWVIKFPEENTQSENFFLEVCHAIKVDMMHVTGNFKILLETNYGVKVLELPYEGGNVSMLILLPDQISSTAVSDFLEGFSNQQLEDILTQISQQRTTKVDVKIPRFTSEQQYDLVPILKKLGAQDLFDTKANLSDLFQEDYKIGFRKAFHKAKIQVNEEGTKAAAATTIVGVRTTSVGLPPPVFYADHPFVFLIYEKLSRTVLFFGIFHSP